MVAAASPRSTGHRPGPRPGQGVLSRQRHRVGCRPSLRLPLRPRRSGAGAPAWPPVLGFKSQRGVGKSLARDTTRPSNTKMLGTGTTSAPKFAPTPCSEKYTWKIQAAAPHPHPEPRTGQPAGLNLSPALAGAGAQKAGSQVVRASASLRLGASAGLEPRPREWENLLRNPRHLRGPRTSRLSGCSAVQTRPERRGTYRASFPGWRLPLQKSLGVLSVSRSPTTPSQSVRA